MEEIPKLAAQAQGLKTHFKRYNEWLDRQIELHETMTTSSSTAIEAQAVVNALRKVKKEFNKVEKC